MEAEAGGESAFTLAWIHALGLTLLCDLYCIFKEITGQAAVASVELLTLEEDSGHNKETLGETRAFSQLLQLYLANVVQQSSSFSNSAG